MKTITLTGPIEGKTMRCGLHQFVDGVKEFVNDDDADKAFNFISKYWACEIDVPPKPVPEPEATPYLKDAGPAVVDPNVEPAKPAPEPAPAKPAPVKPTPKPITPKAVK